MSQGSMGSSINHLLGNNNLKSGKNHGLVLARSFILKSGSRSLPRQRFSDLQKNPTINASYSAGLTRFISDDRNVENDYSHHSWSFQESVWQYVAVLKISWHVECSPTIISGTNVWSSELWLWTPTSRQIQLGLRVPFCLVGIKN